MNFHDIRFPIEIALGSSGGPERRTDIITMGSGREERNQRWAHSRRKFDAGYGVKTFAQLSEAIAFFEERRGRLFGFRWRDRLDWKSSAPGVAVSASDQQIGMGDGVKAQFQLQKRYGSDFAPYFRRITRPVMGSLVLAVAGIVQSEGAHFTCDYACGDITFLAAHIPANNAIITAGFHFDTPVRFDTDFLECDLTSFEAGSIPKIPIIEILE